MLNLLFDGMAKDLPDEFKLAWLARLGEGDKEKFCSLLNTLQPELVRFTIVLTLVLFVHYLFFATKQDGNDITLPYGDIISTAKRCS